MSTPTITKLGNTGRSLVSASRLDPGQRDMFNRLRGGLEGGIGPGLDQISSLAGGGTEEQWRQLEAPAFRQFNQIQGDLASRFSGAGTGARRSSGFQNASSGAAADLAERLQSKRLSIQMSSRDQLLDLYSELLGMDTQRTWGIENKRKNSWGGAISGATSGALAGSPFGPWGTAAGGLIGGVSGFFAGR
jgi:hypothetical protein